MLTKRLVKAKEGLDSLERVINPMQEVLCNLNTLVNDDSYIIKVIEDFKKYAIRMCAEEHDIDYDILDNWVNVQAFGFINLDVVTSLGETFYLTNNEDFVRFYITTED